jgi:hypothetical protein
MDPKVKDVYALHDKGIKTIVSLRTNPEFKKEALCEKLGMKWINIKTGVFKTPSADQFDQFRAIVNNPKNQPVYVSCEVDMDRTLVYIAAQQMCDEHWTTAQIETEFKENHQKRWWPIFRKYERKVMEYANMRGQTANAQTTTSTTAANVQTTTSTHAELSSAEHPIP